MRVEQETEHDSTDRLGIALRRNRAGCRVESAVRKAIESQAGRDSSRNGRGEPEMGEAGTQTGLLSTAQALADE